MKRRLPLLALFGPDRLGRRCLFLRAKWTSQLCVGTSGFDLKLKPSIPHRSALRCSLFLERSTPCAWSHTNNADEVTREMRLIAEGALRGHIGEPQPVIAQLFLGQHDALLN
jgi:hypothetical protein